jgi:ketosteroid isomerase-like protein
MLLYFITFQTKTFAMKGVLFLSLCFLCLHSIAQNKDEQQILQALNIQKNAWNKGDIHRFMETYWHNDSLMFIGKSGVTYGWQNTLNNYKKGYPDTAAMGKLDFDILHVKRLSGLYFSVVGKWNLTRSIGNVGGHFTLLFKKIKNKWLIVSDHSS